MSQKQNILHYSLLEAAWVISMLDGLIFENIVANSMGETIDCRRKIAAEWHAWLTLTCQITFRVDHSDLQHSVCW